MNERLKQLREERARIVTEMQALTEAAASAKRDLTAEEVQKHETLFEKTEEKRKNIETVERQIELERQMAVTSIEEQESQKQDVAGRKGGDASPELRIFRRFLNGGMKSLTESEQRGLQAGSDPDGGSIVAPQEFVQQLLKAVDAQVFLRDRATKLALVKATSLGFPTLDTDPSDADWTTELGTGSEDTAMKFGKRELAPNPLAKRIKISKKLLRSAILPVESIVMERLAYKFAVAQEKAFLLGTGAKQPLGVFTASDSGVPTTRDVSTGNTTTSLTFDGIIEAKFKVKAAYWSKAEWLFHPDAVKQLMKLKDGEGQYIWRMSVRDGEPDTLLGRPLMLSEFAPNTFTTGLYVGMFADFSKYMIADSLGVEIQRLTELYAESYQDGFIGRAEVDGAPVLPEAYARLKLA